MSFRVRLHASKNSSHGTSCPWVRTISFVETFRKVSVQRQRPSGRSGCAKLRRTQATTQYEKRKTTKYNKTISNLWEVLDRTRWWSIAERSPKAEGRRSCAPNRVRNEVHAVEMNQDGGVAQPCGRQRRLAWESRSNNRQFSLEYLEKHKIFENRFYSVNVAVKLLSLHTLKKAKSFRGMLTC